MREQRLYSRGEVRTVTASDLAAVKATDQQEGIWFALYDRLGPDAMEWALTNGPFAYLPHACDLWKIGGPVEIRALIADLQVALSIMERNQ